MYLHQKLVLLRNEEGLIDICAHVALSEIEYLHGCAGLNGNSSEGNLVAPPANVSGLW